MTLKEAWVEGRQVRVEYPPIVGWWFEAELRRAQTLRVLQASDRAHNSGWAPGTTQWCDSHHLSQFVVTPMEGVVEWVYVEEGA